METNKNLMLSTQIFVCILNGGSVQFVKFQKNHLLFLHMFKVNHIKTQDALSYFQTKLSNCGPISVSTK